MQTKPQRNTTSNLLMAIKKKTNKQKSVEDAGKPRQCVEGAASLTRSPPPTPTHCMMSVAISPAKTTKYVSLISECPLGAKSFQLRAMVYLDGMWPCIYALVLVRLTAWALNLGSLKCWLHCFPGSLTCNHSELWSDQSPTRPLPSTEPGSQQCLPGGDCFQSSRSSESYVTEQDPVGPSRDRPPPHMQEGSCLEVPF